MKLIPVALAIFYKYQDEILNVWVQKRAESGEYHNLLEFPGGKIKENESPLQAVLREVEEEVGFRPDSKYAKHMGIYPSKLNSGEVVLLNVFIFSKSALLESKGLWLSVENKRLSSIYKDMIPPPNHQIIDDLFYFFNKQSLGFS